MSERVAVGVAARLSRYLQVLTQAKKMGKERISSQEMSDYTNINATQIRRDLSAFGKFGKRGVGYSVDGLLSEIRKILRTQGQHNIALVGAGRLGQAIASSSIFAEHGINIAAIFDKDPELIGRDVGSATVLDASRLGDVVREKSIVVGVIAVPADAAQGATDELVHADVKIIFNYSEALLDVPADVQVHTSNPAVELLHALYFHLRREPQSRARPEAESAPGRPEPSSPATHGRGVLCRLLRVSARRAARALTCAGENAPRSSENSPLAWVPPLGHGLERLHAGDRPGLEPRGTRRHRVLPGGRARALRSRRCSRRAAGASRPAAARVRARRVRGPRAAPAPGPDRRRARSLRDGECRCALRAPPGRSRVLQPRAARRRGRRGHRRAVRGQGARL